MRKILVWLLLATAGCATPVPIRSYQEFTKDVSSAGRHQYPITVNYNITVDSLIKDGQHDGNYFLLNPAINSKNFSLTVTGKKKIKAQLIHFNNQPVIYSEILAALDQRHLRPANIQEFLSFVRQYDADLLLANRYGNLQELICLSSPYKQKNSWYSEVVRWYVSNGIAGLEGIPVTVLDLTLLELNWLSDSYFLVVSADSKEEDLDFKPKTIEFK